MKKGLTNATIYFVVVCAVYLLILLSPEWFGFYGLMLFYMAHFIGLLLVRPFYIHTVNSSRLEGHFIICGMGRVGRSVARELARKPVPFDKEHPFKNLGIRTVRFNGKAQPESSPLAVEDVELTAREFQGINGVQQFLRNPLV